MWDEARTLAIAFLCAVEDACAEHRIPCPGGHAILDSHHRLLWDANHIRVETPREVDADALIAAAEQHLGGERFRMIELLHEQLAEPLRQPLARAGYQPADRVLMFLGEAVRAGDEAITVEEITRRELELSRVTTLSQESELEAMVNAQLISRDAIVATVVTEQCIAAIEDGQIVGRCQLYGAGPIMQIEHVYTLVSHRRRGYGGAVVRYAAQTALERGASAVFLLSAADESILRFHRQAGFVAAGRVPRFLRLHEQ